MVSIVSSVEKGVFHTHFSKTRRCIHISDTVVLIAYCNWFKCLKLVLHCLQKLCQRILYKSNCQGNFLHFTETVPTVLVISILHKLAINISTGCQTRDSAPDLLGSSLNTQISNSSQTVSICKM